MIKRVIWGVGVLAIACGGGDSSELSPETAPSASQSDSSAEGNGASDEVNRTDAVDAATTGADADLEIPVRARDGSGTNAAVSGGGNGSNAALDGRGDGSGSVTPADDPASSSNTGGNDPADGDPAGGDPADGDPADGDPADGDSADGDPADGDPADGDPADNDPADSDPVSSGADVTEQLLDVETLAHGQFSTFAVGGGSIYVADQSATVLARLPTQGGEIEPITPTLDGLPYRLAADGAHVYSALFQRPGHTELWQLPVDGESVDAPLGALLGEVRSVAEMGVNTSGVVSLEERPTPSTVTRRISRADEASGVATVGSVNLLFYDAFALDESAAYVVRGAEGVSDVVRVDLASGDAASLLSSAPGETLVALAAADGVVYFASTTRVGRIPGADDAAGASTLNALPAYRLVADSAHVYFLTASGGGCAGGSELYRVAATGGTAEHIAHEPAPGCIADFASDAGGIYWLTADGSQLRALHWR